MGWFDGIRVHLVAVAGFVVGSLALVSFILFFCWLTWPGRGELAAPDAGVYACPVPNCMTPAQRAELQERVAALEAQVERVEAALPELERAAAACAVDVTSWRHRAALARDSSFCPPLPLRRGSR